MKKITAFFLVIALVMGISVSCGLLTSDILCGRRFGNDRDRGSDIRRRNHCTLSDGPSRRI